MTTGNFGGNRSGLVRCLLAVALGLGPWCGAAEPPKNSADDAREEDHQKLVALREQFTAAINDRDFDSLKPLVTETMTFTSISNRKLTGLDELKSYWDELFEGDASVLKSLTVNPVADERTAFFGETVGVTQGSSTDTFDFRRVGKRELTTRWTAVVLKVGGQWRVARVHVSANVLDNPMLDARALTGKLMAAGGVLVGFLLGALLFRRRKG